jgi:hypothetical protein
VVPWSFLARPSGCAGNAFAQLVRQVGLRGRQHAGEAALNSEAWWFARQARGDHHLPDAVGAHQNCRPSTPAGAAPYRCDGIHQERIAAGDYCGSMPAIVT